MLSASFRRDFASSSALGSYFWNTASNSPRSAYSRVEGSRSCVARCRWKYFERRYFVQNSCSVMLPAATR